MEAKRKNNKIIIVLGPTASGKSELAVKLAKKFNGEIISADSRQVYKGMDIGSGKVEGKWQTIYPKKNSRSAKNLRIENEKLYKNSACAIWIPRRRRSPLAGKGARKTDCASATLSGIEKEDERKRARKVFLYKNIPHYCIDYVSPRRVYTAVDFKKCAEKAIEDILSRGKIPIICGGTGFYISAALGQIDIPEVEPDWKLRKKLEKKTPEELFKMLKKLDPERAKAIDAKNPRRLIRAIEIALISHQSSAVSRQPLKSEGRKLKAESCLFIGIKLPQEELKKKIKKRLIERIKQGMIKEVKKLKEKGVSWKRLYDFGLEYRWVSLYLRKKITEKEMIEKLYSEICKYAKRQMVWFKKYAPEAKWVKNYREAEQLCQKFLQNKK